jgi:hypothetical protein
MKPFDSAQGTPVAVILHPGYPGYPGCVFFEVAPAAEVLASRHVVEYFTPDGRRHQGSNGAVIAADASDLETCVERRMLRSTS